VLRRGAGWGWESCEHNKLPFFFPFISFSVSSLALVVSPLNTGVKFEERELGGNQDNQL
jgi:hypothetical protein